MERVESVLFERASNVPDPLGSMLRHALGSGKRLRPALVVLTGRVFAPLTAPFFSLAAAVEALHAGTLVHDDVVDDASTRRGQVTLHKRWPVAAAILSGDYLLAQAAALVSDLGEPRVLKCFAETLCTLCAGEIEQMYVTPEGRRLRENYDRSIEAKTASLTAASTEMSAILAGATEAEIAAMRRYGREFGMAFQIVDDVLDFVGDEQRLGKPTGSDLRQGLITLPTLHYLTGHNGDSPVSAVLEGHRDEGLVQAAVEAVRASGAIDAALSDAWVHVRQGQEALVVVPDNTSRHTLSALAEYVVERTY
jgi:geranylgeranyl pyrophosphate synthase